MRAAVEALVLIVTIGGALGKAASLYLRARRPSHASYQKRLREENEELDQLLDKIRGGKK